MRRTHRHSYEEKFHNHRHMTINQCDLSPLAKDPKVIVHRRRVKTENSLSETININLTNHGFLITSSPTARLPVLHHQFRFLHWILLCFSEWTPREWLVWITFPFYFKRSWSAGTVQWLNILAPPKKNERNSREPAVPWNTFSGSDALHYFSIWCWNSVEAWREHLPRRLKVDVMTSIKAAPPQHNSTVQPNRLQTVETNRLTSKQHRHHEDPVLHRSRRSHLHHACLLWR